ncbi:hypothetical protein O2K51_07960 [Apibacter raozihei]|uniref:hypothetical protein n=1 Tax=Apibacter raozihei TaxID=2500547 RepID=UPI000FE2A536|nr:hypothetical protein [Apibacter raozihei]
MDNEKKCEETIGLFLVNNCLGKAEKKCENCGKEICREHFFTNTKARRTIKLCLTCKSVLDKRLTSNIELYSPERSIWRKKMMNRFKNEYPFLVTMNDQYGPLFNTIYYADFNDSTQESSYFDS